MELGVKPIKKWNKLVNINYRDVFASFTKSAVSLATGNLGGAVQNVLDSIKALSLVSEPEELAYQLIVRSLLNASREIIEESGIQFTDNDISDRHKNQEILDLGFEKLRLDFESSEFTISSDFFSDPSSSEVLKTYKELFFEWLKRCLGSEKTAQVIANRLDSYFLHALDREWAENYEIYETIFKSINTPFSVATKQDIEWKKYQRFLVKQVEEPMMHEAFGVKDVYISLRGYSELHEESIVKHESKDYTVVDLVKEVLNVEEHLTTWVKETNSNCLVKVISGGPGSGKSTLIKILASNLVLEGAVNVLYIPMQYLNVYRSLSKGVYEFMKMYLSFNPLDNYFNSEDKLILLFDGLDELASQGQTAQEVAKDFVISLNNYLARIRDYNFSAKAIITGRELAVQTQSKIYNKEYQIIHLLPYLVEERNLIEGVDEVRDPQYLLDEDQRNTWWKKFSIVKNLPHRVMPNELRVDGLKDITTLPLLKYLVAFSFLNDRVKFTNNTNLNEIYEDLIRSVYSREYEGKMGRSHAAITEIGIDEKGFIRVLEEIAIAAWQGGEVRGTTITKVEKHLEQIGMSDLFNSFKAGAKAGITRLLAAFYFRKRLDNKIHDETFEFTHKSFGEYLAAIRIFKLLRVSIKKKKENELHFDDGWNIKEMVSKWVKLLGANKIDFYIIEFIKREVSRDVSHDNKDVNIYKKTLIEVVEFVVSKGVPVYSVYPNIEYKEAKYLEVNFEYNLFFLLSMTQDIYNELTTLNFPDEFSLSRIISRYKTCYPNETSNVLRFNSLRIKDQVLKGDLSGIDFNGSDFYNVIFGGANLFCVDMKGCQFEKCSFHNANLEGINLSFSKFIGMSGNGNYNNFDLRVIQLFNSEDLEGVEGLTKFMYEKLNKYVPVLFSNEDKQIIAFNFKKSKVIGELVKIGGAFNLKASPWEICWLPTFSEHEKVDEIDE